jgi:DNA-binding MarR family transcriptional regulator
MPRKRPAAILIPEDHIALFQREFPDVFDPSSTQVVFAIRALAQRIIDRAAEWLAPYGLTATKFTYLAVLYARRESGITLNELSTLVHTSNATVTSMIDSLEREGLVERTPHPTDRRSVVVIPTAKGKALVADAFAVHHRSIDRAMATFDAGERAQLLDLLVRLGNAFAEPVAEEAAGAPSAAPHRGRREAPRKVARA